MKKISLLLLPFMLMGCDKPSAEVELMACCGLEEKLGVMRFKMWDDGRVVLNVKGSDIEMSEDSDTGSLVNRHISWVGTLPDTNEKIIIDATYDLVQRGFKYWGTSLESEEGGYQTDAFMSVDLQKHKAPSKVEICINKISKDVFQSGGELYVERRIKTYEHRGDTSMYSRMYFEKIPADDAVNISANWDYSDLKIYDKGTEEHEQDACETLERLERYIKQQGWDKPLVEYKDEIGCETPQQVVYLGCDRFVDTRYEYLTLNICEDGRHTVLLDSDVLSMKQETRNGHVVYSGTADGTDKIEVMYNSEIDKWFARWSKKNGAFASCDVGQLAPHQICARQIASITQLEPDGRVSIDIEQQQTATENGYSLKRDFVPLTQEQALQVTKNWDYNNIKNYSLGNEAHEVDACKVLDRLGEMRWNLRRAKRN